MPTALCLTQVRHKAPLSLASGMLVGPVYQSLKPATGGQQAFYRGPHAPGTLHPYSGQIQTSGCLSVPLAKARGRIYTGASPNKETWPSG
jgi:hypothetical protein